jgi:hypothetical protein
MPAYVLVFLSVCLAAPGPQTLTRRAGLLWAFGAIRTSSNPPKIEPVSTQMVLSSGDKLKIMIEITKTCFVYVIHKDTQGNLTLLFPYSIKQFDTDYQTARKYYAPKADGWFQLDNTTGKETFYLIASDQRLLDIEYTYQQYTSSLRSEKQNLAEQMISKLDRITQTHLNSSDGVMPEDEHYAMRGFERATGADPMDVTQLAREISFDAIYSETFTIDHR